MKQAINKIINVKNKKIIIPDGEQVFIFDYINELSSQKTSSVLPIHIGQGAKVQYVLIVDPKIAKDFSIIRNIYLNDWSQMNSYQVYFGEGNYKVNINNDLGKEADLNNQVIFWQKKNQILQVQDNYIFEGQGATGQFKINGLVDDSASAQYYSDVIIKKKAQLSSSRIDMRLYLLSPEARGRLLPGLKIAANDVKAGHSASTLNLSPEDLFYLQTRGLNSLQIKNLVINSIISQFVSKISDSNTKDLILKLISERSS